MDKKKTIQKISFKNPAYPSLLKEIADPPAVLYALGNLPDEKNPRLAIVGTRKATPNGCLIAKTLAKKLSEAGCVIVSGLAMGIDTASHEGVVAAQGKTVAVLGNGLNEIYPRLNRNLAEKILALGGAVISEYPPAEPAFPANFLARNRIISGLCLATIVVEAPERSGSLVTARLALEQNREVFIIPGPANHPNYAGSNRLIREGARLITSAEDVLEDLNLQTLVPKEKFGPEEKLILDLFLKNKQPLSIDKIIDLTKLEPQKVSSVLTFLLLKEAVKETIKGYIIKA